MSSSQREHIHPVMLNATFYVGLSKLQAKYEISKSAAVLKAINDGLYSEGVISKEDYDLLSQRYTKKLKDIIAAGREDSHKPVLTLEQKKEKQKLENKNKYFKEVLSQWDTHRDPSWRLKKVKDAEIFSELEYAKLLLLKAKECDVASQPYDTISQTETEVP